MKTILLLAFIGTCGIFWGCDRTPLVDATPVNKLVPPKYRQDFIFEPGDATFGPVRFTLPVPKDGVTRMYTVRHPRLGHLPTETPPYQFTLAVATKAFAYQTIGTNG